MKPIKQSSENIKLLYSKKELEKNFLKQDSFIEREERDSYLKVIVLLKELEKSFQIIDIKKTTIPIEVFIEQQKNSPYTHISYKTYLNIEEAEKAYLSLIINFPSITKVSYRNLKYWKSTGFCKEYYSVNKPILNKILRYNPGLTITVEGVVLWHMPTLQEKMEEIDHA